MTQLTPAAEQLADTILHHYAHASLGDIQIWVIELDGKLITGRNNKRHWASRGAARAALGWALPYYPRVNESIQELFDSGRLVVRKLF